MFPEQWETNDGKTIPYVIRDVIPDKTEKYGILDAFGIVPKMTNTGSFTSQPFDIIQVC